MHTSLAFMNNDKRLIAVLFAGAAIRLALFANEPLVHHAGLRLELATPVTSWKSRKGKERTFKYRKDFLMTIILVQEGIHLYEQGLDPYEGSIYRQVRIAYRVNDGCA